MTPKNLDHVVLQVHDMSRSLAFYCDMLGLKPERLKDFRQGRAPFVSVRIGSSLIDLFPSENPGSGPHHLCLEFEESITKIEELLAAHNIPHNPPDLRFGAQGMGSSLYVHDPDGHMVELRSYGVPRKPIP